MNKGTKTAGSAGPALAVPDASVLSTESVKRMMTKTVVMFAFAVILGGVNWVLLGLPLLPTISDTWTKAPASYISRYIVGSCCLLFQVANIITYRSNQDTGKYAKASWVNKLTVFLSVTAVFALSWIGAVCDSKSDSCRGDNNVHMMFAYTFFIAYNMYMIILTVRAHKHGELSAKSKFLLYMCLLLTALSKARVLPADGDLSQGFVATNQSLLAVHGSQDIVAVVEWTDVAVIMIWTLEYVVRRTPGFAIATVRLAPGANSNNNSKGKSVITTSNGTQVLNRVSGFTFATASTAILFLLLVVTFVVEVFITRAVPLPSVFGGNASWPDESALWVSAPSNWLARWSLVCAAVLLVSYNSLAARTFQAKSPRAVSCLASLSGYVGCLGMALAGCVDQYENPEEHDAFMTTAFVGLNAFAVMVSAVEVAYERRNRLVFAGILLGIAGTLLRTFVAASTDDLVNATADEQARATAVASVAALLQWANTVILLLFIVFYTRVKLQSFEQLGMAIVYTPPSTATATATATTTTHCRAPVSVLAYADVPQSSKREVDDDHDDEAVVVCVTARLAKEYDE